MTNHHLISPCRQALLAIGLSPVLALLMSGVGKAQLIEGGSITMTLDQGTAASIDQFNAYFGPDVTRSGALSDSAPGTEAFTLLPNNQIQLVDNIRPAGVVPSPYPGTPGASRSPQETTLDVNLSNVLGSWTPSTDLFGAFVDNTASSEQIAFTSLQRWTSSSFTGSLLYGDFALRYASDRVGTTAAVSGDTLSGLVLTSNIDFLNASWADLGNVTITPDATGFEISGDLLISGALNELDPTAIVGTKFGTFDLNASTVAVPEPSSTALFLLSAGVIAALRGRNVRKRHADSV